MTKEEFRELAEKIVVLDGATGSNLMKAGMPRGVCTEEWVLEHEQVLIDLQRAYVEAGSQIVYAPTFGANRLMLSSFGKEKELVEMNRRLVELSQRAAEGRAYVAGDITTGGRILGSTPEASYEEALERYKEQISALEQSGVDLLVAETMINIDETVAAVEAAQSVSDLPILCSMTIEADGSIFSGGNILEAMETLQTMGADAVGVNCSVGPDQLVSVISNLKGIAQVPVIAKPNAGMPTITEKGEAIYSMNAEDFGKHMAKLMEAGAGVIGGCCGTTPEFIKAICKNLDS